MQVLVTGASGFVGKHLVKQLVEAGHTVYSFVRKSSRIEELERLRTTLVYGDICEISAIEEIFRQHPEIDTVFHLASLLTPVSVNDDVYWNINYQGTKNLLDVCQQARLRAYIHCSTVGVIGPLPHIPADETSRCAPDSNYGTSKYQAELLALEYHRNSDLPVTVVRPAWIYGPGDRRTFTFFRMVAKGRFFIIGDGQTQLSPVYIDDVVQGLILCAEQIEKSCGEIFIVSGAESVTLETLATTIAQASNSSILPFRVPGGVAHIGAIVCEKLCKPFGVEPPIHHRRLDFFFRDQAFDISKIQQILGFRPQVDVSVGVKQTITWYKEHGWL